MSHTHTPAGAPQWQSSEPRATSQRICAQPNASQGQITATRPRNCMVGHSVAAHLPLPACNAFEQCSSPPFFHINRRRRGKDHCLFVNSSNFALPSSRPASNTLVLLISQISLPPRICLIAMAYSPEAAALILNSCNDAEIAAALQSNPELFARLQNLPKAKAPPAQVLAEMASSTAAQPSSIGVAMPPPLQVPQALQMGVLPTFSHIQLSPSGSCQYQHRLQLAKAPQPRRCQLHRSPAQHPLRLRILRSQLQAKTYRTVKAGPASWHSNWWQGWRDWHSSDRRGWDDHQSPPRGSRAQPNWQDPTKSAPHVDVQRDGWQWSYQLDEAIMHSSRGRPYYKSRKSGKFLCAIQCTVTHCNHMRPACNFSIRDPENDNHGGHLCSYCRQDLEWRKARHEAGLDPVDD